MLPDLRRFANTTRAIAADWSSRPFSNDTWTSTGIVWGNTNNRPLQVVNAHGLAGVQKPGHDQPTNPFTAATEKIVADLAHCISLPVPPVTLWDRGAGAVPQYVAVSAWAYDNVLTWGQAAGALSQAQSAQLLPWASAMLPFESWISATDRQNPGNVLVSLAPSGEILGAWIDYSFSLDYSWKGNHIQACNIPPLYPPVGAAVQADMIEVAERIKGMDNTAIEGIVNRIPIEYLPRGIADNILRNLLSRRDTVRALF